MPLTFQTKSIAEKMDKVRILFYSIVAFSNIIIIIIIVVVVVVISNYY